MAANSSTDGNEIIKRAEHTHTYTRDVGVPSSKNLVEISVVTLALAMCIYKYIELERSSALSIGVYKNIYSEYREILSISLFRYEYLSCGMVDVRFVRRMNYSSAVSWQRNHLHDDGGDQPSYNVLLL